MNSKFIVKLALTTAVVAVPTVGCTSVGNTSKIASASAGQAKASAWAQKAEKAFAKHDNAKALMFAEMSVEADNQNRDYRAQLARIYMAEGRFASAERTFMDVMDLGQVDPRTVVSLALSRIAQGKVDSAISLVEANRSIIPASDYGLTLALAGQTGRAVDVLAEAIRLDNASARTRQNLALAYALDGRWNEARIMAVQDMTQDQVNERVAEWAQYARPGAYQTRIAGLLNVTPVADDGQPVRLALNSSPANLAAAEPVETPAVMADAAPVEAAPVAIASVDPSTELAAVGPAPSAENVAGFASVEEYVKVADAAPAEEAPLIKAPEAPVKTASAPVVPIKLALAIVEPIKAVSQEVSGSHVVQLGAFSNSANANKAWAKYSTRFAALHGFNSASTTVNVGGKSLVRLAATGFGNKASADNVCRQIKASGGDCVVKAVGGEGSVRLAWNGGKQLASR